MVKTVADEIDYLGEIEELQSKFRKRAFRFSKPQSEFPELFVTIPDDITSIQLAPLYDVHIGSPQHDSGLLEKHLKWIADTPNVFTWDGGDAFDNITPHEAKMGHTPIDPEEQLVEATRKFAQVQHKMLFKLPGNHEDRTYKNSGMSSGRRLADNLRVPYFKDYCFCTIRWRGNNFRLMAHHGAGGATTAGAQRNSARKEITWAKPDILWTGHLHQALVDTIMVTDYDQKSGRMFERSMLVMISPSYLRYFDSYAAKMRYGPGTRGISVAILNEDGRIDANIHARGKRL